MQVEAGIAERALASSLIEVLAGLRTHRLLVLRDEGVFVILRLDPELGWNHEVGRDAALGTRAYCSVVKLFRHTPLADARQTEDMSTFFQDAKSASRGWILFHDRVHADATIFVHTALDRKRKLHLLLMFLQTLLH